LQYYDNQEPRDEYYPQDVDMNDADNGDGVDKEYN
jgi:hypothetical protein